MLLSINSQKIEEQLAKNPLAYTVVPCNLEPVEGMKYEMPTAEVAEVNGTLSVIPPDLERAHARLLSLRNRIIDSGHKPLSSDELDREINETRGR